MDLTMATIHDSQVLFDKALKPGGVYFIEDLLASRWGGPWLDPEPERVVMVRSSHFSRSDGPC